MIPLAHDAAALRAQEGEHGEDPAIVFGVPVSPSLSKIRRTVPSTLFSLRNSRWPMAEFVHQRRAQKVGGLPFMM